MNRSEKLKFEKLQSLNEDLKSVNDKIKALNEDLTSENAKLIELNDRYISKINDLRSIIRALNSTLSS